MRMTWERFELTGAVEDYLLYKGIDRRNRESVTAAGTEGMQSRRETEHGTVNNSDRHGVSRISIR